MQLRLDIKPATVSHKPKGFFSSTNTINVHRLTIDLKLTDAEYAFVKSAGIDDKPLVTVDPEATGCTGDELQNLMRAYDMTGGRPYITIAAIHEFGRNTADYMTLPAAQKALEEVKAELIGLKAMLERASDPSSNTFEL